MPSRPDLPTALRYAATCVYGSEGFRDTAFLDTLPTVPVWTIGHGSTIVDGKPVRQGMTCTRAQADEWASQAMLDTGELVEEAVHVPLNEMQLAALISLAYNIGIGRFRSSSVLEALNLALYQLAAERMLDYNESGHKVRAGLVTRRARERAMFLTGSGVSHDNPNGWPRSSSQRAADTSADALNAAELGKLRSSDPQPAVTRGQFMARLEADVAKLRADPDHSADDLNAAELAKRN